ncbi:pyridoxamine 5'-phosphate oxidase [archaeon BMS3Abin16]|nr:pyridoxamine 5'-phosphate oxidase [archaeon BMS3Abin16]GBE56662.1 pyridoxamine 5'-phosphate oxidase [archaeon BMS3Bbin16]HDY73485.1 PPOX class F420-dependent oxidoreductase [Euryarchaeota archaeon]
MTDVPKDFIDLFEKKGFAHLATIMPDGSPQVTPVWVEYESGRVLVNSAKGRRKDLNMRERPKVALSIQDPDNPYRYLEVRGTVVDITEEGGDAHIDRLAKKYLGVETYPYRREGEVRVIYRIRPDKFSTYG